MALRFQDSLAQLVDLPDDRLHRTTLRWRKALGDSEWKMSLCLLAWQRRGIPPPGYRSLSHYAEFGLQLSGKKMARLLATARALEHLPLFSEAFREGLVEWSKVRELQTLITPETERDWLEYAQTHSATQVARKVAVSPMKWKRQQALLASLRGQPIADSKTVSEILQREETESGDGVTSQMLERAADVGVPCTASATVSKPLDGGVSELARPSGFAGDELDGPGEASGAAGGPDVLSGQVRMIRMTGDLTPDQYVAYEAGKKILEARAGRRLKRGEVIMLMAEAVINSAPARARARHQILIHTIPGTQGGWYETDRGILPADPDLLEFVNENGLPPIVVPDLVEGPGPVETASRKETLTEGSDLSSEAVDPTRGHGRAQAGQAGLEGSLHAHGFAKTEGKKSSRGGTVRRAIPMAVIRAVIARAAGRCECCDSDGPLHFHHPLPVCEGGGNDASDVKLVCGFCHHGEHLTDFNTKAHWARAREAAIGRRNRESPS